MELQEAIAHLENDGGLYDYEPMKNMHEEIKTVLAELHRLQQQVEGYDEITKSACALVLTAPKKPSKWALSCLVDRKQLDALTDLLRGAGYQIDKARKLMEAKRSK